MKVFLLEDDYNLNKIIKLNLEKEGLFVTSSYDGYDAMDKIINEIFDIYILDINVSGFDGHEILAQIRKSYEVLPVIMISGAMDIDNIKKSYELGCNDYLKKPFVFEELLIHIKYLLKNNFDSKSKKDIIDLGFGFEFNLNKNILLKHSHEIELSHNEKLLMSLFIKNINKTVTIENIHEYIWGEKQVEAVSMRSLVHKLQKKLKSAMIVNIRGVGYKLLSQ